MVSKGQFSCKIMLGRIQQELSSRLPTTSFRLFSMACPLPGSVPCRARGDPAGETADAIVSSVHELELAVPA
ncbi:hypothetical protein TNCV_1806801 [Trichonephila clavipes]|nr:hypothetical protein TNCV_1806801 [Trichonephila clavipes]